MNLPNKITLSRIFLVPVFMLFIVPFPDWVLESQYLAFIHPELNAIHGFINSSMGKYIAAAFFIIAASTDGVDGYIARKKKLVTKVGQFLDPIADKLLISAALIGLVQRGDITGWAAMIIIAREFLVTGFRLIAVGEGVVISASNWGKIKTITQMTAIVLSLLDNFPLSFIFPGVPFNVYVMIIAIGVTIYSGYDYMAKNKGVLGKNM